MSELKREKAERQKVKLRLSISSPTGYGKTWGALEIAKGMVGGDMTKVGVIDTENKSASLYAPYYYGFDVINLDPPYSAERYMEAFSIFGNDPNIEVIIGDSITHVWKGAGGLLEHNDKLGGRFSDWAKTTPIYQAWLNTILHSPKHVITTMRKKQAYAQTVDESTGKKKVEKLGLEDEIRGGYDYEMTVAFEIINDKHLCYTSKDRTKMFVDHPEFVISEKIGKALLDWCEQGLINQTYAAILKPWLDISHPNWHDAVKFITEAHGEVSRLKARYSISPEVEAFLNKLKSDFDAKGTNANANTGQATGGANSVSGNAAAAATQPATYPVVDDEPF